MKQCGQVGILLLVQHCDSLRPWKQWSTSGVEKKADTSITFETDSEGRTYAILRRDFHSKYCGG